MTQEPPRQTQEIAIVVGEFDSMPSAPDTYFRLVDVAGKRGASLADLAAVLESDPALGVNVLHLVNSAFFGRMQRTSSIAQAVSRLGLEPLKALVLSAHVFSSASEVRGLSLDQFQAYSVKVARLARDFVSAPRRDEAFTVGLVHDIGKLVLALSCPDQVIEVGLQSATSDQELFVLEREFIGVDHAEAGAYLLTLWQIPHPIVKAVRYHHQPSRSYDKPDEVLAAVHAADALIGILTCGEPESRLDLAYLEAAGVADRLPQWRELVLAA